MGMFDYLKCSTNIGPLTNIECQTKDIEECIGGTMSFYWVDPVGALWYVDYSDTADFAINDEEGLPIWRRMKVVPNGRHGKVTRCNLTKYIVVYSSKASPDGLLDWDYCRLHFVDGILEDFKYINKHIQN